VKISFHLLDLITLLVDLFVFVFVVVIVIVIVIVVVVVIVIVVIFIIVVVVVPLTLIGIPVLLPTGGEIDEERSTLGIDPSGI
jgi:hypothetical protein